MSDYAGDRSFYRVGGVCALLLGVGYVVIVPLFAAVGAPPSTGEAWLMYLAGKTTVWWIITALSVVTDLLYVPVGLALYAALRQFGRYAMQVALAFTGLFVVLDLALTWSNFASLLSLEGQFAAAGSETERAQLIAAANYPASVLASHLSPVYSIVILSFAILVIGVVMLRASFSRVTGYVGMAVGVTGLISITAWNLAVIVNALLTTLWALFVGYRLLRIASR
jgi:hypothetical protein